MSVTVTCPRCQQGLNVPDDLLGKRIKCPACGTNFQGAATPPGPFELYPAPGGELAPPAEVAFPPASPAEPRPPDRPPAAARYREAYDDYGPRRPRQAYAADRDAALSSLKPAAIGLLATSILGVLVSPINAARVLHQDLDPNQLAQLPPSVQAEVEALFRPVGLGLVTAWGLMSVIALLGAIMMLKGRKYWLAVTGSITAMLNFNGCCCVLGLVFGIWSLVLLLRPEVKAAFGPQSPETRRARDW